MTFSEVSRAISLRGDHTRKVLEKAKLRVDVDSEAGRDLLYLATEYPKRPIAILRYEEYQQSDKENNVRLYTLATRYEDETILNLINEGENVEFYLEPTLPVIKVPYDPTPTKLMSKSGTSGMLYAPKIGRI